MLLIGSNKESESMESRVSSTSELGGVVRAARKAQALSQEDLAGMTGTGRRFISELEQGKNTAQVGKVFQVLRSLGVAIHLSHKWTL